MPGAHLVLNRGAFFMRPLGYATRQDISSPYLYAPISPTLVWFDICEGAGAINAVTGDITCSGSIIRPAVLHSDNVTTEVWGL